MPPEWQGFALIAQQMGIPLALLLSWYWLGWREVWIWGATHRSIILIITEAFTKAISERDKLLADQRDAHQKQLSLLEKDRDFWRGAFFEVTDISKKITGKTVGERRRVILTKSR